VSLPDAGAGAAINPKLVRSFESYATEEECADSSFDVEGGMDAAFNERGAPSGSTPCVARDVLHRRRREGDG
jgi:hypothetical protein